VRLKGKAVKATRKNFTDQQKAEIYARDRAICAYTGMSLWLLDYGASPTLSDQVDHQTPASHGGGADIDNGVLCNHMYNYVRRNGAVPVSLFEWGLPTTELFWVYGRIPRAMMDHMKRFSTLHYSDWYLNRAVFSIRLAAASTLDEKRIDGKPFVRGRDYYCKAALRRLNEWREILDSEKPGTLAARGLLPTNPGPDHEAILQGIKATTAPQVVAVAEELDPYITASYAAVTGIEGHTSRASLQRHLERVQRDRFVVDRTKRAVVDYVRWLLTPPA